MESYTNSATMSESAKTECKPDRRKINEHSPGYLHYCVAKVSNFIDDNYQIIKLCTYGVGAAGLILALHGIRVFTRFTDAARIPPEFIYKHITLHATVRKVTTKPPSVDSVFEDLVLLPISNAASAKDIKTSTAENISVDDEKVTRHVSVTNESNEESTVRATGNGRVENKRKQTSSKEYSPETKEFSQADRQVTTSESKDGMAGTPDNEWDECLQPLYLLVEHSPIVALPWQKSKGLLPLHLSSIEITQAGFNLSETLLSNKGIWFTMLNVDPDHGAISCFVRRSKFTVRKSFNEELVKRGLGILTPIEFELEKDRTYTRTYLKLIKAQNWAEKKRLGYWKNIEQPKLSILRRIWNKLRNKTK